MFPLPRPFRRHQAHAGEAPCPRLLYFRPSNRLHRSLLRRHPLSEWRNPSNEPVSQAPRRVLTGRDAFRQRR